MNKRVEIRDFHNKILGFVDTDSITGKKTIRDFSLKILGTYDPKRDETRDFYQRIVGKGDLTLMLLNKK